MHIMLQTERDVSLRKSLSNTKAADTISEIMVREFPGRTGMAARVHPTRFIISEAQQERSLKNMAGRR